jgi:hypothetical protein
MVGNGRRLAAAAWLLLAGSALAAEPPLSLDCLHAAAVESVRADPRRVAGAYRKCRAELALKLGPAFEGLDDRHLQAVFASIVAHAFAPYGQSSALELDALRKEPRLDCDNYAALTGYLVRRLPDARKGALKFVGYDGGPVGNHAQLFYRAGGREILLDPTVGVVARVGYAAVLQGAPVPPGAVADFYRHGDRELAQFKRRVVAALIGGSHRPEQTIYVAQGLDNFLRFGRGCARRHLKYAAPRLPEICRRALETAKGRR